VLVGFVRNMSICASQQNASRVSCRQVHCNVRYGIAVSEQGIAALDATKSLRLACACSTRQQLQLWRKVRSAFAVMSKSCWLDRKSPRRVKVGYFLDDFGNVEVQKLGSSSMI